MADSNVTLSTGASYNGPLVWDPTQNVYRPSATDPNDPQFFDPTGQNAPPPSVATPSLDPSLLSAAFGGANTPYGGTGFNGPGGSALPVPLDPSSGLVSQAGGTSGFVNGVPLSQLFPGATTEQLQQLYGDPGNQGGNSYSSPGFTITPQTLVSYENQQGATTADQNIKATNAAIGHDSIGDFFSELGIMGAEIGASALGAEFAGPAAAGADAGAGAGANAADFFASETGAIGAGAGAPTSLLSLGGQGASSLASNAASEAFQGTASDGSALALGPSDFMNISAPIDSGVDPAAAADLQTELAAEGSDPAASAALQNSLAASGLTGTPAASTTGGLFGSGGVLGTGASGLDIAKLGLAAIPAAAVLANGQPSTPAASAPLQPGGSVTGPLQATESNLLGQANAGTIPPAVQPLAPGGAATAPILAQEQALLTAAAQGQVSPIAQPLTPGGSITSPLIATENSQLAAANAGTITPAAQAQIDQYVQAQQNQLYQQIANMGVQDPRQDSRFLAGMQQIAQQAETMKQGFITQEFQTGTAAAGQAASATQAAQAALQSEQQTALQSEQAAALNIAQTQSFINQAFSLGIQAAGGAGNALTTAASQQLQSDQAFQTALQSALQSFGLLVGGGSGSSITLKAA